MLLEAMWRMCMCMQETTMAVYAVCRIKSGQWQVVCMYATRETRTMRGGALYLAAKMTNEVTSKDVASTTRQGCIMNLKF